MIRLVSLSAWLLPVLVPAVASVRHSRGDGARAFHSGVGYFVIAPALAAAPH